MVLKAQNVSNSHQFLEQMFNILCSEVDRNCFSYFSVKKYVVKLYKKMSRRDGFCECHKISRAWRKTSLTLYFETFQEKQTMIITVHKQNITRKFNTFTSNIWKKCIHNLI